MSDQEYGKCECCGKEAPLTRTYFYYDIPCECCGCTIDGKHYHSEMVSYCKDCTPDIPKEIHAVLKDGIDVIIKDKFPNKIRGRIRDDFSDIE